MLEIYVVRHGQASFGSDNYDALSPLGHQQAQWLGEHFKQHQLHFDHTVVGDMVRHHETAVGIFKGLDISPANFTVLEQLNEFDFEQLVGAYLTLYPELIPPPGSSAKVYLKLLKKAILAWQQALLPQPLTESWAQFSARIAEALRQVKSLNSSPQRVLVVTSGGATAMMLKHVLELSDKKVMPLNLQITNTSVSRLTITREDVHLVSFNNTPHLDSPSRQSSITYS